jgi:ankyrin repeat protein
MYFNKMEDYTVNYFNKIIFLSLTLGLSANSLAWAMQEEILQEEAPDATESEISSDQYPVIDKSGWTDLHKAVYDNDFEAIEEMLQRRTFMDAMIYDFSEASLFNKLTALHLAVFNRNTQMVELLISHAATVNYAPSGTTALHIASYLGDIPMVELLISHGATVDYAPNGMTALYLAVDKNQIGTATTLLAHGANPNSTNNNTKDILYGFTPLHLAAYKGQVEMVEFLINHGADINAQVHSQQGAESNGLTALHLAAINNYLPIIDILLRYNANARLKNGDHLMAFDLAQQQGGTLETIEKLMLAASVATDQCIMCFEALNENDHVIRLPCEHIYGHINCLANNTDTHCPLCQTKIDYNSTYELVVTKEFLARAKQP